MSASTRCVERGALEPVQPAEVGDVLARRELRVDARAVRQHADAPARRERVADDVDAVDRGGAAVGPQHGVEDAKRRGLAGAIRAEQAGDAPVAGLEADAVHGAHGAEAAREAFDADHGALPLKVRKKGAGWMRATQARIEPGDGAGVDELAQQLLHAGQARLRRGPGPARRGAGRCAKPFAAIAP